MPGEVSDGDRQWLYEHCEAFLFPSLAEGFGFPVLEAMQCGKPVFLSRATSLPEIGGDVACYFDSFEALAMKQVFCDGMQRLRDDSTFRARAIAHAAGFGWSAAAKRYADIYLATLRSAAEEND